ncbi:hypothetical protein [Streptomyces alkaliterrae]|uniref:Uncharacterized protein n=1 Tax=Streptomyces alkaliterrae TaxID=2213162 RepID=A0A5P0YSC4_9ACTN|nr:hypothetical protein [Streptomyces alkaliterrae]MBB1261190.1 hypothetical protein [Streptomyces alkaliterrae]MQS03216.1 hypothetical protein [Streptomyces alkaliterrae]
MTELSRRTREHAAALAELAARLGADCAAAVHPEEIAALLESEGLNDQRIRERYGFPDSFALADELFARVPRAHHRAPAPDPGDGPRAELLRCLVRGVVFTLPALAFVLGSPFLSGPPGTRGLPTGTFTLLAGALCGWAWSQALSHRAHFWLGLGGPPGRRAAARALARGASAGVAASVALAALAALLTDGAPWPVWVFCVGQAGYLAGATVLLVLGHERALLAALLPVTAGGVLSALRDLPDAWRAALLGASLAAVLVLAVLTVLAELGSAEAESAPRYPSLAPPLWSSVPYGLLGLGVGVLVMLAILADVLRDAALGSIAAPTALALSLSMGPAEYLLGRFRHRTLGRLRDLTGFAGFRTTVAVELARGMLCYLALLLPLAWLGSLAWPYAPGAEPGRLLLLLLLGATLWAALLLQAFGRIWAAVTACGLAAGAELAGLLLPVFTTVDALAVQLAVCGATALVLPPLAWALLGRATAHR